MPPIKLAPALLPARELYSEQNQTTFGGLRAPVPDLARRALMMPIANLAGGVVDGWVVMLNDAAHVSFAPATASAACLSAPLVKDLKFRFELIHRWRPEGNDFHTAAFDSTPFARVFALRRQRPRAIGHDPNPLLSRASLEYQTAFAARVSLFFSLNVY
jgi:hypothetical protein